MLYPEGLPAAVWFGSGEELPQGKAAVTAARLVRVSRRARGLSGGLLVPLTGRATHPTATRFFLLSFFFIRKKSVTVAVVFDDVVNVFVAASGTGGEDGAVGMFLCPFDGVGDGVRTFEGGDNAFVT